MVEEMFTHPKFPHIVIKRIKTREDLLMCLKVYAERSILDNLFIKQMKISAKDFYEQGLLPYTD